MASPQTPPLPAPRALTVTLIALGLAGFLAIAADVVFRGQIQRIDLPLHIYLHEHAQPTLILICAVFSGLGELAVVVALALVVGIRLATRKHWRTLAVWILALAGSGIINPTLKHLFKIPRPSQYAFYIFKADAGYTFPSGHTMAVAIAAGALALVILRTWPLPPVARWLTGLAAAVLAVMEAFALLYIGVHYLTDVLAALALSTAWIGTMRWLLPPTLPATPPVPLTATPD